MTSNRRQFLAGAAGLGLVVAGARAAQADSRPRAAEKNLTGLPSNWRALRKLDAHNHVFLSGRRSKSDWTEVDAMVEAADVLGIEKLFCSRPITAGVMANIEVVKDANDSVLEAIQRHPRRIVGYCFVQPGN